MRDEPSYPAFSGSKAGEEDERQRLEMEALEAGDGIEVWEDVEVVTRRPPIVLTPEEEARAEVLRAEQEMLL